MVTVMVISNRPQSAWMLSDNSPVTQRWLTGHHTLAALGSYETYLVDNFLEKFIFCLRIQRSVQGIAVLVWLGHLCGVIWFLTGFRRFHLLIAKKRFLELSYVSVWRKCFVLIEYAKYAHQLISWQGPRCHREKFGALFKNFFWTFLGRKYSFRKMAFRPLSWAR